MDREQQEQYEDLFAGIAPKCDECEQVYDPPVYYTFPRDFNADGHVCTANLCPDCAGPFIDPDNPNDPRRPT